MLGVGLNHILGLLLDTQGVLEHIKDEGQVDVTEVIEPVKFLLVRHTEIVIEQVTVVPRVISICSKRRESKVGELHLRLIPSGGQVPRVERVHEASAFLEAVTGEKIALHVVTLPKRRHVIIIHRILEVLVRVEVSSEFAD